MIGYRPLAHWAMAVSSRSATASTERNRVMLICAVFGAVYIYICMVSGGSVAPLRSQEKKRYSLHINMPTQAHAHRMILFIVRLYTCHVH